MFKYFLLTAGLIFSVSTVSAATLARYEFNGDLTDSSGNGAEALTVTDRGCGRGSVTLQRAYSLKVPLTAVHFSTPCSLR